MRRPNLCPPSPDQVQEYFDKLITTKQCRGLKVNPIGDHGKVGLNYMYMRRPHKTVQTTSLSGHGSAFYHLQSCINHSCYPNAKAFKREEDGDGQATIIACRPISKGEDVTISCIDEDLPFEDRQAMLADYGFRCRCSKCLKEEP